MNFTTVKEILQTVRTSYYNGGYSDSEEENEIEGNKQNISEFKEHFESMTTRSKLPNVNILGEESLGSNHENQENFTRILVTKIC